MPELRLRRSRASATQAVRADGGSAIQAQPRLQGQHYGYHYKERGKEIASRDCSTLATCLDSGLDPSACGLLVQFLSRTRAHPATNLQRVGGSSCDYPCQYDSGGCGFLRSPHGETLVSGQDSLHL